ncbi:MAG: hypothetical protein K2J08_11410 [Ruminococcus sp.]|nr:hypothetical protein [Ruminococcus sp.]
MLNKIRKIYPFIYGIFGSLGLICYIHVFCVWDYRQSEHPYAHPFSIIAGSISLILCIAVFCFDIVSFMTEDKKIRRLLTEFMITVISFFGGIFVWAELWNAVSEFIRYIEWVIK